MYVVNNFLHNYINPRLGLIEGGEIFNGSSQKEKGRERREANFKIPQKSNSFRHPIGL